MELTGAAGERFAPRIFRVTFGEPSRWHGLEARITDAPAGPLVNLLMAEPLAAEVAAGSPGAITAAHRVAVDLLIREFAPLVIEWNVNDPIGLEVQPHEGTLRGQDFQMVMALFRAWREGRAADPVSPEADQEDAEADLASVPMAPVPAAVPG